MKHFYTLTFLLCTYYFGSAQINKVNNESHAENTSQSIESIQLSETEFDFGKIPQGKPVIHNFGFKNIGNTIFSLNNVQASCGCTTPEWNKDKVAPGQSSSIIVGYNAASEGPFNKTITIFYNGNQTKVITIKGDVWKTPLTSAPLNTALDKLKAQH